MLSSAMTRAMTTEAAPSLSADRPPLALIAGPTASGKTALAVDLALALAATGRDAVVINADSAQVYADLAVLSARPSPAEMRGVPHRLFGEWDAAQICSAADWAKRAQAVIAEAQAAGTVPILVGGTGLYLRTLIDGIAPVPPVDPSIRAAVRDMPVEDVHAALRREDPPAAARLAPADRQRLSRALVVVRSTRRPLASWQAQRSGGIGDTVALHPAILLPPRETLYRRCDARFGAMVDGGALAEVERLMARNLPPDAPVLRAIGVPELAANLGGSITLEEAAASAAQATRRYAKRQYTWFTHQPPAEWPRHTTDSFNATSIFASLLRQQR